MAHNLDIANGTATTMINLQLTPEGATTLGQLLFKARLGFQRDARSNTKRNTGEGLIAARSAAQMADQAVALETKLTEARTTAN